MEDVLKSKSSKKQCDLTSPVFQSVRVLEALDKEMGERRQKQDQHEESKVMENGPDHSEDNLAPKSR